jgi:hypothetical protein
MGYAAQGFASIEAKPTCLTAQLFLEALELELHEGFLPLAAQARARVSSG